MLTISLLIKHSRVTVSLRLATGIFLGNTIVFGYVAQSSSVVTTYDKSHLFFFDAEYELRRPVFSQSKCTMYVIPKNIMLLGAELLVFIMIFYFISRLNGF